MSSEDDFAAVLMLLMEKTCSFEWDEETRSYYLTPERRGVPKDDVSRILRELKVSDNRLFEATVQRLCARKTMVMLERRKLRYTSELEQLEQWHIRQTDNTQTDQKKRSATGKLKGVRAKKQTIDSEYDTLKSRTLKNMDDIEKRISALKDKGMV